MKCTFSILSIHLILMTLAMACQVFAADGPPAAATQPVVEDYFGVKISDPYRYFENLADPRVQTWIKGQADYAHGVLSAIPGRDRLLKRIAELDGASRITSGSSIAGPMAICTISSDWPGKIWISSISATPRPASNACWSIPNALPRARESIIRLDSWFLPWMRVILRMPLPLRDRNRRCCTSWMSNRARICQRRSTGWKTPIFRRAGWRMASRSSTAAGASLPRARLRPKHISRPMPACINSATIPTPIRSFFPEPIHRPPRCPRRIFRRVAITAGSSYAIGQIKHGDSSELTLYVAPIDSLTQNPGAVAENLRCRG